MSTDRLIQLGVLAGLLGMLVGVACILLLRDARRRRVEERVVRAVWGDRATVGAAAGLAGVLHRLGEWVRRGGLFYSAKDLAHLHALVLAAGFDPKKAMPILLGGKLALMVLLPVAGAIVAWFCIDRTILRLLTVAAGMSGGILVPEWIIRMVRRRYTAELERGTPDALDLLVVCSEAGMGLESAVERVAQELQHSNRATAAALAGLLDELRVLPDRRQAFVNFGARSGVEGLQRLSAMLGQTLQYGTPLSQALRAVAMELRRVRMNRLEEKSVRLPAMLIFPMIFFIMPSLYIVLLGTSFMRLVDSLRAISSQFGIHH